MPRSSEADIHFEFYRHLQNAIDVLLESEDTHYSEAIPELNVNGGFADIVIMDGRTRPFVVIEAKRPSEVGMNRNLDPYSPLVIRQAFRYAAELGAKYFATYNGAYLILFRTFEEGVPLLERMSRSYHINDIRAFASEFLREIILLDDDILTWDPHHEAFIKRLRTYHSRLSFHFQEAIRERLDDYDFKHDFECWAIEQGWKKDLQRNTRKVIDRYRSQAAYILMNKLVFYKLLEDSDAYEVPEICMDDLADSTARRRIFDWIITNIDFEAIYQQDPIFDQLPLNETSLLETKELLDELNHYDLSSFDHDVIGQIYQGIIPADERHDLGQYYTPPEIVSLINKLCITGRDEHVLDPACGSGGFLVDAYARLKELNPGFSHQAILEQIHGIDINRFPAHLTAINLALRNLNSATHTVNIEVGDFFNVDALQGRFYTQHAGVSGEDARITSFPQNFDAIVGNPPYIRQEQIANKRLARNHLGNMNVDLNRRSDIYCYFFTHASEFLNEGGRIGFLTSSRWLNVEYGEFLQDFFLDNFRIISIINFSRQVFDIALIGTCVTILEKCASASTRDENKVVFLEVHEPLSSQQVVDLINTDHEIGLLEDESSYRILTQPQCDLRGIRKWNRFFCAPNVYWELYQHPQIVQLSDAAIVKYGLKTGANGFFYFRSRSEYEDLGIDSQFIKPLLKHERQATSILLSDDTNTWYVLDLHAFVEEVASSVPEDLTLACKNELAQQGYNGLLEYINIGEIQGVHDRSSVKNRRVWFDLGDFERPPLTMSKEYWRDTWVLFNEQEWAVDNRMYGIWPHDDIDVYVLGGILNSSFTLLMREMHGRTDQGQGLNRNTVMVYEAERLPIIDPQTLSMNDKENIKNAFTRILMQQSSIPEEEFTILRRDLDIAVLSSIEKSEHVDRLIEAVAHLVELREIGSGQYTGRMIDPVHEDNVRIQLRGAHRIPCREAEGEQLGFSWP
ncbi:MAG: N-6 DNA methylase [Candidatus Aegiribacteria sp.]|nr:N-6 DNA methylase [Candidatus Aegiribacteria sp.]